MSEKRPSTQPYTFTEQDLTPDRFTAGAKQTLESFYTWRDDNPDRVAAHVNRYTDHLHTTTIEYGAIASLRRSLHPSGRETFKRDKLRRDIGFFCVYNLGEIPDEDTIEKFTHYFSNKPSNLDQMLKRGGEKDQPLSIVEAIGHQIPILKDLPGLTWLEEQLRRLQRILPEAVIQNGGMGKAARTTAGLLAIGLYDTLDEPLAVQREHLTRILPAAYAYGAMYPIIDDTLQDGNYVSASDKSRYHEIIMKGIQTGGIVNPDTLPDHPLAEELVRVYDMLLDSFPFDEYRHLYYAGESMYLAQHRDSNLTAEDVARRGLTSLYPDIFVKASMTRVVANIIGRRALSDDYYRQAVNVNFINQFRDDLQDHREDERAGRLTPFTYEGDPTDAAPLHDLFAYSAYIAEHLFDNDPLAIDVLTQFSAYRLAVHFLKDPEHGQQFMNDRRTTDEMAHFIRQASNMPSHISRKLQRPDLQFQDTIAALSKNRLQTDVDPRTFISDRMDYINQVVLGGARNGEANSELDTVATYALEAGGKRLRPALTLILAESMGLDYRTIEPILKIVELFHTSSLIFDDLPAQDNAMLRRGKATAHVAFGEGRAQLAGIAMMSSGFGMLSELGESYPADRVMRVLNYFGSVLGARRLCLGQDMDLCLANKTEGVTTDEIIQMYNLKTSTLIEAALVPLMMLEGSSPEEIELIKKYSYHAGIVFQIRDDILDMTEGSKDTGKDANNDIGKANIARLNGLEGAELLMQEHLNNALECCQSLSFNTNLLEGIVRRFAERRS